MDHLGWDCRFGVWIGLVGIPVAYRWDGWNRLMKQARFNCRLSEMPVVPNSSILFCHLHVPDVVDVEGFFQADNKALK